MVERMAETIGAAAARRIALAAQGFGRPLRQAVGTRQINGVIDRLGLLQIDSVNVFERSHYLPVFARLGSYDRTLLDRLTLAHRGPYLEYWAHEAAFLRREDWPLFRWRMRAYRERDASASSWAASHQGVLQELRAELRDRGPLAASSIERAGNTPRGPWWDWSDAKIGLEHLFRWGEAVSAGRNRFERRYELAEVGLSPQILGRHMDRAAAFRELLLRASIAHGIGTERDFADYYRLKGPEVGTAIRELEELGELLPVTVAGWQSTGRPARAWLHRDARIPRRISATALLSPFDPVVWDRARAERLFGFRYRIEIYTPAEKRIFGYYVLPLLLDDRLVGRVDLKSDRQAGVLRVQAAWREPHAPAETAERLAALLAQIAQWQGLSAVQVVGRGDLAPALAAEVARL